MLIFNSHIQLVLRGLLHHTKYLSGNYFNIHRQHTLTEDPAIMKKDSNSLDTFVDPNDIYELPYTRTIFLFPRLH